MEINIIKQFRDSLKERRRNQQNNEETNRFQTCEDSNSNVGMYQNGPRCGNRNGDN